MGTVDLRMNARFISTALRPRYKRPLTDGEAAILERYDQHCRKERGRELEFLPDLRSRREKAARIP